MSAVAPQAPPTSVMTGAPRRVDAWWVTPVITVAVLGATVLLLGIAPQLLAAPILAAVP